MMADMKIVYQHEIDLSVYRQAGLTADGVWKALEDFARKPHEFIETLTSSTAKEIVGDTTPGLERELTFGQVKVTDVIEFARPRMTTLVPEQGNIGASRFDIDLIENDQTFSLRFSYSENSIPGVSDHPQIQGLREKAWLMKDRGIVRRILERSCA